jgi:hypothetical protein
VSPKFPVVSYSVAHRFPSEVWWRSQDACVDTTGDELVDVLKREGHRLADVPTTHVHLDADLPNRPRTVTITVTGRLE